MNLDRFYGEPENIPIVKRCARCNKAIYEGDVMYDVGEYICEDCADAEDKHYGVKRIADRLD